MFSLLIFFFFFQAEDGIRDFHVTGVQTCALPILGRAATWGSSSTAVAVVPSDTVWPRSEERRVGKECRSRGSPDHKKKKKNRSILKKRKQKNTKIKKKKMERKTIE